MITHVPRVCGVANLVEGSDKLVKPVLLETDPHVKGVVRGSRTVELPSPRDFGPGVLELEVIPPLGGKRLGSNELSEPEEECGRPEHGDDGSLKAIR